MSWKALLLLLLLCGRQPFFGRPVLVLALVTILICLAVAQGHQGCWLSARIFF